MKRKWLPVLAAFVGAGFTGIDGAYAADNIPTVYGLINVTLNNYKFESIATPTSSYTSLDNWTMESNASRLGVKGDYPVRGDLKAVYKLEYEVRPDGSSGDAFSQRNIYAGLQGGWGTLFAGKSDTPLKVIAAGTIQQFKDLPLGDFKYVMVGENRINNIIQYSTPNLGGFIFDIQAGPGEDSGTKGAAGATSTSNTNHGLFDSFSAALIYKMKGFYAGIANDHNELNTDTLRVVGQVDVGPVKLGALWQKADRTNSTIAGADAYMALPGGLPGSVISPIRNFNAKYKSQDAYALTAAWSVADWTFKGQYAQSTSEDGSAADLADTKARNYAVGADYRLDKNVRVFGYYAAIETEGDNAAYDGRLKDKTLALGWEFKF